ncbi:hypothetical protein Ciccas_004847 [Cichlidogyrus casuarinus]|uniref:Uncharacterized protein n=1 Tax=Cichlidogyrus casuarinus TaxID=1844966 RepID=A0ABD2QAB8_9PLAT
MLPIQIACIAAVSASLPWLSPTADGGLLPLLFQPGNFSAITFFYYPRNYVTALALVAVVTVAMILFALLLRFIRKGYMMLLVFELLFLLCALAWLICHVFMFAALTPGPLGGNDTSISHVRFTLNDSVNQIFDLASNESETFYQQISLDYTEWAPSLNLKDLIPILVSDLISFLSESLVSARYMKDSFIRTAKSVLQVSSFFAEAILSQLMVLNLIDESEALQNKAKAVNLGLAYFRDNEFATFKTNFQAFKTSVQTGVGSDSFATALKRLCSIRAVADMANCHSLLGLMPQVQVPVNENKLYKMNQLINERFFSPMSQQVNTYVGISLKQLQLVPTQVEAVFQNGFRQVIDSLNFATALNTIFDTQFQNMYRNQKLALSDLGAKAQQYATLGRNILLPILVFELVFILVFFVFAVVTLAITLRGTVTRCHHLTVRFCMVFLMLTFLLSALLSIAAGFLQNEACRYVLREQDAYQLEPYLQRLVIEPTFDSLFQQINSQALAGIVSVTKPRNVTKALLFDCIPETYLPYNSKFGLVKFLQIGNIVNIDNIRNNKLFMEVGNQAFM